MFEELILAIAIVFLGAYVQSSIGFGLAIIAAPILFFIDPLYVPAPVTVCALTLSLANALKHRHAISFQGLKFAIIGRIPGTVLGGLLLLWISQQALALWIGLSVVAAVILSLRNVVFNPTNTAMLAAGFMSGFMGTSSSIGGPPMALILQHQANDFIRANMAAFFVISCIMSLAMLATVGHFGLLQLRLALPLIPACLAGYWVAMRTVHLISHQNLRRFSLTLCAIAGLIAIFSYWR